MNKDKEFNSKPVIYAMMYPILRDIALKHGWALTIHGTCSRDCDVVLIPWSESCTKDHTVLIREFDQAINPDYWQENQIMNAEIKPFGRLAYSISTANGGYFDISVIPIINNKNE